MTTGINTGLTTDQLLQTALDLGMEHGWESLSLSDIAHSLQVPMTDIYRLIRQKDDLAEYLFDRADRHMLSKTAQQDFQQGSGYARLQALITAWLETLVPYRPIVREMLCYKLEPGHIHLQVLGLLRISRTVQWMLHAASMKDTGLRRINEEIILTNLYLAAFSYWLFRSPDDSQMQRFLSRLLWRYR
jgi:ubiquinone biosynthesis protein COQ9